MGNNQSLLSSNKFKLITKERKIEVSNIDSRVTKEDRVELQKSFDRLQQDSLINKYMFRMEVLGAQVPDVISERIFSCFATCISVSAQIQISQGKMESTDKKDLCDGMCFQDLLACYLVFKHQITYEMGQLVYEMMKLSKDQPAIGRDDLLHFCKRIAQLDENFVNLFFKRTKLDPRIPITKDEFLEVYPTVNTISLFTIINELIGGFKDEYINIEQESLYGSKLFGLSEIQIEKSNDDGQKIYGLSKDEVDIVREFFDQEIRGNDAMHVLKIYKMLIKGVLDEELHQILISAITKHKGNNFDFFLQFVACSVKEKIIKPQLEFLFDAFSEFKPKIEVLQIIKFCEIFEINGLDEKVALDKITFVRKFENIKLNLEKFQQSKYLIMALTGLKSDGSVQEQQKSITQLLGLELFDVENYIQENLDSEKQFFIIEKEFWDNWSGQNNLPQGVIDNQKLIEFGHQYRLKDSMSFNEDFIIVPKYVFNSLSKWYKCNKTIELKVHQCKTADNILRIANSRVQNSRMGKDDPIEKANPMSSIAVTEQSMSMKNHIFQKVVNDVQYSLEIYPKIIYFQMVEKDGKKPYQDQTKDYKAEVNKDGKISFNELRITKKETFDSVMKHLTEFYHMPNQKKARLLIDDQLVSGIKLSQSLEEFGLMSGQLIYIEFLLPNNTWPSDVHRVGTKKQEEAANDIGVGRTNGLYNMGNTCYMNSALQCIVNIRFLHEYYVKEKMYMRQLNLQNHLGHKGDLVLSFANLMQQMWNSNNVVVPKGFKHVLGKINEQFRGDDQQDSQEYLNFLIDGLHEETNLRKFKPYIENPESNDRDLIEVGLEAWSNSLRRDWSFIFFLFYGQMKSTIECLTCNKESTTFEVFTNIPVSLPEPSQLLLNIIVHRLPNKVKCMLQTKKKKDDQTDEKNYIDLTNDQPIYVCLKIDKNMQIRDVIKKIMAIPEVNIDFVHHSTQHFSDLVLFSKQLGTVRGIFDPVNKFTQYKIVTNEIHAQEILTQRGREYIKLMYQHNPNIEKLTDKIFKSQAQDEKKEDDYLHSIGEKRKNTKRSANEVFGKAYVFNNYLAACDKFEQLDRLQRLPDEVYTIAYHRRFIKKSHYFFHPYQPQLLSSPIILMLPSQPSGLRIYQEVWSIAHNILKSTSKFLDHDKLWWRQEHWKELLKDKKGLKPFVLKTVDRQGYSCSQCNWVQKCSGCIIEPGVSPIKDFLKKCHLAIEWHSNMIEEEYNPMSNEIMRHSSIESLLETDDEEKVISLDKCLQKFHDVEKLTDSTYCSKCKDHQTHQKSFEIFRPPPILTIQLKRFKRIGNQWRKLQNLVEFPIYNLDISNHIMDYKFMTNLDITCQYDLMGVINHYGSLSFGHYVSMNKNPYDGQWYKYDDQLRIPIPESQIAKESAYILFYIRKDVISKSLSEIFPSINECFPGKPISTKYGDGYILGEKYEQNVTDKTYYVKIKTQTVEIQRSEILPDVDQNEIHNDLSSIKLPGEAEPAPEEEEPEEDKGFFSRIFGRGKKKTQIQDQTTEKEKLINGEGDESKIHMENFYVKPGTNLEPQDTPYKSQPVPEPNQEVTPKAIGMRKSSLPPIVGADITDEGDRRRNSSVIKKKKKKKRKVQQIADPELEAKILEDLKDVVKDDPTPQEAKQDTKPEPEKKEPEPNAEAENKEEPTQIDE